MPWLLNLIYAVVIAAASPLLLYRSVRQGKYRNGWQEKLLGKVPDLPPAKHRFWMHAVSVGEVLLLKGLISELRSQHPDVSIVLTTTTATGYDVAVQHYPDLTVCYCPLDFSWAVRRAIARLKPTALVLAELELWPNLVMAAAQSGVRLAVVNGRLSEKSFRGYRKLRPLISRLLKRFDLIAVQNEAYAARFEALGAPTDRIVVTGSVKFDGVRTDRDNVQSRELRRLFGLGDDELVFVAGSTQHPEETYALATWRELASTFPSLRLILVPRHKERFEEVARLVERQNLPLVRRSQVTTATTAPGNELSSAATLNRSGRPILLLDTLGELGACWGLADVAFVGGSLTNRGGQNMIEPAAYGAAVLFGPNTWNFRDAANMLLAEDAARVVGGPCKLTEAVQDLISDKTLRDGMGRRARRTVAMHRGATQKTLEVLAEMAFRRPAMQSECEAA